MKRRRGKQEKEGGRRWRAEEHLQSCMQIGRNEAKPVKERVDEGGVARKKTEEGGCCFGKNLLF